MHPLPVYVGPCLARRLLEPSPFDGVYWSPSIPRKLRQAQAARRSGVLLGLGDFIVSDYTTLKGVKKVVKEVAPGSWERTEIHHIVENFHLQFLGVVHTIDEATYRRQEPCVLMSDAHHKLHVDNIVGLAETVVMESKPLDFVAAFRDSHPGLSEMGRDEQGRLRAQWVREQERGNPPALTREEVRRTLREIYRFAYQEPELEPLRLIAVQVIDGMPG